MIIEKLHLGSGADVLPELPDVLAGQRDTVAEQREILEKRHDALWRALKPEREDASA